MIKDLQTGDRVLFALRMRYVQCGFARYYSDEEVWRVCSKDTQQASMLLRRDEEGLTWCREWDGPIADAFRAQVALS